ncbi:MAG: prolyl oligopeptidase family serine peptidase [Bacteroidia bacterium]|nr:prolyl oligopeptidase family serine peptidase [Bacteroidia bacterium]
MKPVLFVAAFFMGSLLSFAGDKLISAEKVHSLSKEDLVARFKKMNVPSVIMQVTNGIDVYELMYRSHFPDGREVNASGILFVPTGVDKPLPLMVYHHGTRLRKERAIDLTGEQFICSAFAGDGYIVAWPDYFGIGKGDGFHPYQHAETEAQASMDMIRASREFLDDLGVKRSEQLFLTGYSQGGHAAMSAHKFMQERHPEEFKITASSPMSGAYDMTGVQSEVMFQPYEYPMYLPYILLGYYEVYKYNPLPTKLMRAPYDTLIPRIFNGINDFGDVNSLLPEIPGEIFTDEVIQRYRSNDTTFKLRELLESNNVYDWKPESPMMLCYCKADEQVTYKNSLVAYKAMKARGTKHLKKTHAGPRFDHNTCAIYASVYTKYFFDSFRKGSKYGRRGNSWKRFLLDVSKMSVNKQIRKARKAKEAKAAEAAAKTAK